MTKESDRRQRVRIPLQKMIRHSRYQVLGTPVFNEDSALDISSTGISFETEQEYPQGTLVLLELELDGEMIKLLISVAWAKHTDVQGRFQVGGELIAIDPEHKKTMQTHLSRLMRELSLLKPKAKKNKTAKKAGKKSPAKKSARKKTKVKNSAKKSGAKKKPVKKASGKAAPKKSAQKSSRPVAKKKVKK